MAFPGVTHSFQIGNFDMLLFKHTNNVTHVLRLSCFVSSRLSLSSVYLIVVWGQIWQIAAPWLNNQPIIRAWSDCQLGVTFICPFLHISSNINKGAGVFALLWISTRGTFGDIKLHKRVPSNLLRFSLSLHIPHCHNTVDNSYSCSNLLQGDQKQLWQMIFCWRTQKIREMA